MKCGAVLSVIRRLTVATMVLLLAACVTAPAPMPSVETPRLSREHIIASGLTQALEAYPKRRSIRPYAAVYSDLGGLRPVELNEQQRQVSDEDHELLLESILRLSRSNDFKSFAIFGLTRDQDGQEWLGVHFETRRGEAQWRQYPLPPPATVRAWHPAVVEPVDPVIFTAAQSRSQ